MTHYYVRSVMKKRKLKKRLAHLEDLLYKHHVKITALESSVTPYITQEMWERLSSRVAHVDNRTLGMTKLGSAEPAFGRERKLVSDIEPTGTVLTNTKTGIEALPPLSGEQLLRGDDFARYATHVPPKRCDNGCCDGEVCGFK